MSRSISRLTIFVLVAISLTGCTRSDSQTELVSDSSLENDAQPTGATVADGWEYISGPPVVTADGLWIGGGALHDPSTAFGTKWKPVATIGKFSLTGDLLDTISIDPPDGFYWGSLQVSDSGNYAIAAICRLGVSETVDCGAESAIALMDLSDGSFVKIISDPNGDEDGGQGGTTEEVSGGKRPVLVTDGGLNLLHESDDGLLVAMNLGDGPSAHPAEAHVAVMRVTRDGVAEMVTDLPGSNVTWVCSSDGESLNTAGPLYDASLRPEQIVLTTISDESVETIEVLDVDSDISGGRIRCLDDGSVVLLGSGELVRVAWIRPDIERTVPMTMAMSPPADGTGDDSPAQWGLPIVVDADTLLLAAYPNSSTSQIYLFEFFSDNSLERIDVSDINTSNRLIIYDPDTATVRDASAATSVPAEQWTSGTIFPVFADYP